jgi:hypothetical protein
MDYCCIQKSIIQNATSRSLKRVRDQLNHINRSYTFLLTTCTTKNVDLNWDGFVKFYKLLYSIVAIHEHAITKFLDLLHFLDIWVVYREEKNIALVGPNHIPPSYWRLGPRIDK